MTSPINNNPVASNASVNAAIASSGAQSVSGVSGSTTTTTGQQQLLIQQQKQAQQVDQDRSSQAKRRGLSNMTNKI